MILRVAIIPRVALLSLFALGTLHATSGLAWAQTPSPALLIVNTGKGQSALQIADPLTMKVVSTVPISGAGRGNPHEVAVSADGKIAFVTVDTEGGGVDFLSVIDLAARKELRHVEIGPSSKPHGITSAGGKVYYTADSSGLIGRYDPANDRIDWMQGTGQARTHELVISKDTSNVGPCPLKG